MSLRAVRRTSVSIALVVAALAGCPHVIPPPVTLPAPTKASPEELRWVIEAALATRRWTVSRREPGAIVAWVRSQGTGDHATIELAYRPATIEIRCVELGASKARYDRWIQLLSADIQKNAAQLGMGLARPPAPPPPPAEEP